MSVRGALELSLCNRVSQMGHPSHLGNVVGTALRPQASSGQFLVTEKNMMAFYKRTRLEFEDWMACHTGVRQLVCWAKAVDCVCRRLISMTLKRSVVGS